MKTALLPCLIIASLTLTGCVSLSASTQGGDLEPRVYSASIAGVYRQALGAMASLHWTVTQSDEAGRYIQATTGRSLARDSAKITITMREKDGQIQVDANCAAHQVGAAKEFIEQFFQALDAAVK